VGLLTAILMLWATSGTLDISAALEAGKALDPARLNWLVAGFLLAVWVKLGGWPLHVWQQAGRQLTLFSHSWLYATLMPNLGLYLLYRVTPLLTLAAPLASAALWIGAATAALGAIIALVEAQTEVTAPEGVAQAPARERAPRFDVRGSLVYLGAAQGGLALVLAASGVKTGVWLTLLILTPLRLLLFLAGDTGASLAGRQPTVRRLAAGLFALGGLALTAYSLLTTWWARQAGAKLDALLIAELAVAVIGIWAARVTWQLWRGQRLPAGSGTDRSPVPEPAGPRVHWTRWASMAVLGCGVLAGGLAFGALARTLAAIGHSPSLALPTLRSTVRYAGTTPAFLIALVLAVATWRLHWRLHRAPIGSVKGTPTSRGLAGQAFSLEEGLAQVAQILSAVVETGIQEKVIGGVVRAVVGGARATRRLVEQQILEGTMNWIARTAIGGGQLAYQVLEQDGLEGLLRRAVRTVLSASRWMQRQHTGRLRRNLLCVTASLALAILTLVLLA
jgi:NADH:ubiquinone oxidoreductase subunit 5 (subunit L)/multisubunit Na+/H+ antiporter MnhA subunit